MQLSLRTTIAIVAVGYPLLLAALWWHGETILQTFDRAFVGFGIVCLIAVGVASAAHTLWTIQRWPKASATIVRYWIIRSEGQPDGQRFYHPVVRFKPPDSKPMIAISNFGSWDHPWQEGQVISIRYDPQDPRIFQINCFTVNWGLSLICLLLAAGGMTFFYFGH